MGGFTTINSFSSLVLRFKQILLEILNNIFHLVLLHLFSRFCFLSAEAVKPCIPEG